MRCLAILFLAASAWAGPKGLDCIGDPQKAAEIARTRGKMIFLTVIVDGDAENRMVVDQVFRDKALIRISREFVVLYANNDDQHGKKKGKDAAGNRVLMCADCPCITCEQHMMIAQSYARAFFPSSEARTPIHFVLDENEEVIEIIKNGDFKAGFNHVPAKQVVAKLKALLKKRGKGLTEEQYEQMMRDLTDAKAARARDNTPLELEKLMKVTALPKEVEGVKEAKARIQEIDAFAAKALGRVDGLVGDKKWEEALDTLDGIVARYPGTLSSAGAEKRRKELSRVREVKRLLKSQEIHARGMKYLERRKPDLAKKQFEKCVRLYPETKYGKLCEVELGKMK